MKATSFAEAFVEEVKARVLAEVRAELGIHPPSYRTSGPRPPRCSRRAFNTRCRSGAVEATREGRDWVCTREAWATAQKRAGLHLVAAPVLSDDELADRMIDASGARRTKAAR